MANQNTTPTYAFSHSTLLKAAKSYEKEQKEKFKDPAARERINTFVLGLQDFFVSDAIIENKMLINGDPNLEEIIRYDPE